MELDELAKYEVTNLTDDAAGRLCEERLALAYAIGLTLSPENSRVEKAELLLKGQQVDIKVDAHTIWPDADENVVLAIRLDTGSFKFSNGVGLESDSLDQSDFKHRFYTKEENTTLNTGDDKRVHKQEVDFSLRMVFKSRMRKEYEIRLFPVSSLAVATTGVCIREGKMFAWKTAWMTGKSSLPPPLILPGKPFRVLPNAPPNEELLMAMENVFSPPRNGAGNRAEKPAESPGDWPSLH